MARLESEVAGNLAADAIVAGDVHIGTLDNRQLDHSVSAALAQANYTRGLVWAVLSLADTIRENAGAQ